MKKYINEFLFALYLFLFTICKLIMIYIPNNSTEILFCATSLVLVISVLYNIKEKNNKILLNRNFIFIVLIVSLLFWITMIFNYNNLASQYLYEFLIYGIFTMYLFSNIKDYKKFITYFANISIFVILVYCMEPFKGFSIFSDYMDYGITCMLPGFMACCLGSKVLKKKIYLIFELIAFLEILFFCNRGAIIVSVVLEVSLYVFTTKLDTKKFFICIAATIIGVMILLNIENILLQILNYLKANDIDSYSIRTMYEMASKQKTGLSGRDVIWEKALQYYKESWVIGHGIGAFQSQYGFYTHNIFLEILTTYGTFGMGFFIILILFYINKIRRSLGYYRIILISFFIMGVFPLLLSIYTFKWQYFWVFIFLTVKKIPKQYIKNDMEEKSYLQINKKEKIKII